MESLAEPLGVAKRVIEVMKNLGIDAAVGGSLASSAHGVPRATQDIDIVAALNLAHVRPFAEALEAEFYVDEDMIREAIQRFACFNLIHLATMYKCDVFVVSPDPVSRSQLNRASVNELGGTKLPFVSREDIVVQKLLWYERGQRASPRQWNDVLGVVRQRRGQPLDRAYLQELAVQAGVSALLEELFLQEAEE